MAEIILSFTKFGISNSTSLTNLSQNCLVTSLFSYVNFESEIKSDKELISSFEGILCLLIELKDEKSAVLLDEFRIH